VINELGFFILTKTELAERREDAVRRHGKPLAVDVPLSRLTKPMDESNAVVVDEFHHHLRRLLRG
jgi:hypothetical protein